MLDYLENNSILFLTILSPKKNGQIFGPQYQEVDILKKKYLMNQNRLKQDHPGVNLKIWIKKVESNNIQQYVQKNCLFPQQFKLFIVYVLIIQFIVDMCNFYDFLLILLSFYNASLFYFPSIFSEYFIQDRKL